MVIWLGRLDASARQRTRPVCLYDIDRWFWESPYLLKKGGALASLGFLTACGLKSARLVCISRTLSQHDGCCPS